MRDSDILATCGTDAAAGAAFDANLTLQREFGGAGRSAFVAYARALREGRSKRIAPGAAYESAPDTAVPSCDEVAAERFNASVNLQREFGAFETYRAWARGMRGEFPRRG